jgi:xanthine/CO dehydrogenase XdhC/CoxF family maturation factor
LGPRDRTERLLADIRDRAGALPPLDTLHYPIGLDLGGDTPQSVAIAVLAEIEASLNGRSGGNLRLRPTKIHDIDPVTVNNLVTHHPASAAD